MADQKSSNENRVRPWDALRYRDFRLLFASNFLSGTASQMRNVVNLYMVLQLSHNNALLGLVGLFQAVPVGTLGLFAGAVADVVDRKRLILITLAVSLICAIALAVLTFTDNLAVWQIYVFTFISFGANTFEAPARFAILPRAVPEAKLQNAITLNAMLNQLSFFVGPLLVALIDLFGPAKTYLVNALIVIPSAGCMLALHASGVPEGVRRRFSFKMISEGAAFLVSQQVLLAVLLIDFVMVIVGFYRVYLPILSADVYHVSATGLGFLNSAAAIGSLGGSFTILGLGRIRRMGWLFLAGMFGYALSLLLLGLTPWYWLGFLAVIALGYTDSFSVMMRQNVTQLLTPDALRGRASSFLSMAANMGNAFGSLEAGFMSRAIGASTALLIGGFSGLGITVGGAGLWRQLLTFDADKARRPVADVTKV